ncbi:MAG: ChbG/HpnK family deacetylase [Acidobacteria bacterium]|nr:ChbG/HpnK family deacetylase [Acidobacteriota bacterium]
MSEDDPSGACFSLPSDRLLIVNADDFGFTHDVNAGIVQAHREGILTATTLMANGAAFDDAVRLALETPALDVGGHLVLTGGRSVRPPHDALSGAILARKTRVRDELRAQVEKILAAGIAPTHLDTHKHTHLLPWVLEAVARIGEEFQIPWVRRPFDFPLGAPGAVPWARRAVSRAMGLVRGNFHRVLRRHGCRTTDHFAGFQITGRFRTAELVALIGNLPPGVTELMVHPGHCTRELRAARTRLKESREEELRALTAPETRQALETHGVRLVRYRDL